MIRPRHRTGSGAYLWLALPLALVVTIVGLLTAGCSSVLTPGPATLASSPWPMYQHDVRHTGQSPFAGPARPRLVEGPIAPVGYPVGFTVGDNGDLFVGGDDGHGYPVFCRLSPQGRIKWTFKVDTEGARDVPRAVSMPALCRDGHIVFGAGRRLYALRPDGAKLWEFRTGMPKSLPSGEEWRGPIVQWLTSSPAIAHDGTIYFTSGEGKLYAISSHGKKVWDVATPGVSLSSPAIADDGTVYFGSGSGWDPTHPDCVPFRGGAVYAVRANGKVKWRFAPPGDTAEFRSPVVGSDGTVYVVADAWLYALAPDGTQKWVFRNPKAARSATCTTSSGRAVVARNGTIYFVASFGPRGEPQPHLLALRPDGSLRWARRLSQLPDEISGLPNSAPLVTDASGNVFVDTGTTIGLLAFGPEGAPKWHLSFEAGYHSAFTIVAPGKAVCLSAQGTLATIVQR